MHPVEFWWLAEFQDKLRPTMYGSMTEDQVREIYEDTYDEEGNLRDGGG